MLEHIFIVSLENGLLVYDIPYGLKKIEPMHYSSILFSICKLIQSISSVKKENFYSFNQEKRQIEMFPFSQGSLDYIFVVFFNSHERVSSQRRLINSIYDRHTEFPSLITIDGKAKKTLKSLLQKLYLEFYLSEKQLLQDSFLPSCELDYIFSVTFEAEKKQLSINTDALISMPSESVISPNPQRSEIRPQLNVDANHLDKSSSESSLFLLCCCGRNKVESYHHLSPSKDSAVEPPHPQQEQKNPERSSARIKEQLPASISSAPRHILYPLVQNPAALQSFHRQILSIFPLTRINSSSISDALIYFEVTASSDGSQCRILPLPPLKIENPPKEIIEETVSQKQIHDQPLVLQSIEDDDLNSPRKGTKPQYLQHSPEKHQSNISLDDPTWTLRRNHQKIFLQENTGFVIRSGVLPHSKIPWREIQEFLEWTKFCFEEKILPDIQFV